jgi:hypothetical protein
MKNRTIGSSLLCALALASAVLFTVGQSISRRTDAELKNLQGYWEGEGAGGKCSVTITGDSLLYRAGTSWFKTTFTLPERKGAGPQLLHATIKDSSPPTNSVGQVVFAIYKIEDRTLTLEAFGDAEKPPAMFENNDNRYIVKKAQPPADNPAPPKSN